MSSYDVTIIDYGNGNLLSVQRAFEYFGAKVNITSNPEIISASKRIILPGVGAYAIAMNALHELGISSTLKEAAKNGTPILGICLGMQLLFDQSEEFGLSSGLQLVPGRVVPIPEISKDGQKLKVPHGGWDLIYKSDKMSLVDSLLSDTLAGGYVYFVHSFMVKPEDPSVILAHREKGGNKIPAFIKSRNIQGCQFHPEKSGILGLNILQNFLKIEV